METNNNVPGDQSPPNPPVPATCRTRKIGQMTKFGDCHGEEPWHCPHAIQTGEIVTCHHPEWYKFAEPPTKKPQKPEA